MLGTELMDTLGKLKAVEYTGVEDFADKLSFLYSVAVLILCASIIAIKQYLLAAIACYNPTVPSGSDFDKFLENYCWVHGTIPLLSHEKIPQKYEDWEEMDNNFRINYYQWVPFMLGLQCVLFYLPRVFWQIVCYNRTGTDLEHLVVLSNKASHSTSSDRVSLVVHVAKSFEDMLYQHREYRKGKAVTFRRTMVDMCGPLFASKRLGTWLVFTYFMVKLFYLTNAFGQLVLMKHFLGVNLTFIEFGTSLARNILEGREWEETRIFPRISYCYVQNIRHLGARNVYTAQCVLPVNMLNEKVYIFLWFWTAFVVLCTIISIPLWLTRVCRARNRLSFVKKFLRLTDTYLPNDKQRMREFTYDFLRYDGVFLLQMVSLNAGDVITSEIVAKLWEIYIKKYEGMSMLKENAAPQDGTNTLIKSMSNKILQMEKERDNDSLISKKVTEGIYMPHKSFNNDLNNKYTV